jgi:hypothetical protein
VLITALSGWEKSVVAMMYLAQFGNFATKVHWQAHLRVLRYLKTT